jgi:hypothetical protein
LRHESAPPARCRSVRPETRRENPHSGAASSRSRGWNGADRGCRRSTCRLRVTSLEQANRFSYAHATSGFPGANDGKTRPGPSQTLSVSRHPATNTRAGRQTDPSAQTPAGPRPPSRFQQKTTLCCKR